MDILKSRDFVCGHFQAFHYPTKTNHTPPPTENHPRFQGKAHHHICRVAVFSVQRRKNLCISRKYFFFCNKKDYAATIKFFISCKISMKLVNRKNVDHLNYFHVVVLISVSCTFFLWNSIISADSNICSQTLHLKWHGGISASF